MSFAKINTFQRFIHYFFRHLFIAFVYKMTVAYLDIVFHGSDVHFCDKVRDKFSFWWYFHADRVGEGNDTQLNGAPPFLCQIDLPAYLYCHMSLSFWPVYGQIYSNGLQILHCLSQFPSLPYLWHFRQLNWELEVLWYSLIAFLYN